MSAPVGDAAQPSAAPRVDRHLSPRYMTRVAWARAASILLLAHPATAWAASEPLEPGQSGADRTFYRASWAVVAGVLHDTGAPDADALADVASDALARDGFQISRLEKRTTVDGLRRAFAEALAGAGREDRVVLYYVGRTISVGETTRSSYLLGADSAVVDGRPQEAIPLAWLYNEMARSPAAAVLLLVDGCLDDSREPRAGAGQRSTGSPDTYARELIASGGKTCGAAPGPFTRELEAGLGGASDADRDGNISTGELIAYLTSAMDPIGLRPMRRNAGSGSVYFRNPGARTPKPIPFGPPDVARAPERPDLLVYRVGMPMTSISPLDPGGTIIIASGFPQSRGSVDSDAAGAALDLGLGFTAGAVDLDARRPGRFVGDLSGLLGFRAWLDHASAHVVAGLGIGTLGDQPSVVVSASAAFSARCAFDRVGVVEPGLGLLMSWFLLDSHAIWTPFAGVIVRD